MKLKTAIAKLRRELPHLDHCLRILKWLRF